MEKNPSTVRREVRRWPALNTWIDDDIAVEEPLEIRVEDRSLAVTMRTPGHDRELAAGFLLTEGIVDGSDDLLSIDALPGDKDGNTVIARVAGGVQAHAAEIEKATRTLYATSACGICGKASLDRIRMLAPPLPRIVPVDFDRMRDLPEALRAAQQGFMSTGGLHGAALAGLDGEIEIVREDIGRHNAVDKVIGWRLLDSRVPIDDRVLVISGRAGFEIVQKARMAGIGALMAVGAASSLAIELAADAGMTLAGFVRADRITVYTTPDSER